jgi:predicted dehydrogenase
MVRLTAVLSCVYLAVAAPAGAAQPADPPLRLAIAGLTHGHVDGFLRSLEGRADVRLVAVFDPDPELRAAKAERHRLAPSLLYDRLERLLEEAKPLAVAAFGATSEHPAVVEACAARGVHVMMEKPLAVGRDDGERIRRAASAGRIHVLVNYETTWYPSHAALRGLLRGGSLGAIRRLVAMDGHEGPKEIGVGPEFLGWLTDPVRNGGGALFDFGCYGANLMTWLMDGQRPLAVTAVTRQLKPQVYPRVDDDATLLIEYPGAVGVAQASWNWPFGRKDLEVYAERGYAHALGSALLRRRLPGGAEEDVRALPPPAAPEQDPVSYLVAVVRGASKPSGLSSLENNLVVTEILDAARQSAREGRRVPLR